MLGSSELLIAAASSAAGIPMLWERQKLKPALGRWVTSAIGLTNIVPISLTIPKNLELGTMYPEHADAPDRNDFCWVVILRFIARSPLFCQKARFVVLRPCRSLN